MDKPKIPLGVPTDAVSLAYVGDAEAEASALVQGLRAELGLTVAEPVAHVSRGGALGIPEVLVTVVLSAITQDLVRRLLKWLFDHLGKGRQKRMHIVITLRRRGDDPGRSFPFLVPQDDLEKAMTAVSDYVAKNTEEAPQ